MLPEPRYPRSRAVLLDRDGTINVDCGYLSRPDQLQLLPHAVAGMKALSLLGLSLVVITNQSGIGRGYFSEADLARIHERLVELLAAGGVDLAGIYHCPHHSQEGCGCRKPAPGMVHRAARELGFDPAKSFLIGDKLCDFQLGHAVGARSLSVRGPGNDWMNAEPTKRFPFPTADDMVEDLEEAAGIIGNWLKNDESSNGSRRCSISVCDQESAP